MTQAASAAATPSELSRPTVVHGLLLVDKPAGLSSHDVVGRVRRMMRTRRVGHAGTLDPFATGLLVCAVGNATRLLRFVDGEPKVYRTRVVFGTATDTDDLTGTVVATGAPPDWTRLDGAIASLTGTIAQVPPAYSAKHVDGERAYAIARRGEAVQLPPVNVSVAGWTITERGDSWLEAEITCGGGTYIRALARDLAHALGTVGHCASLRRVQSGPLRVEDAVPLDAMRPGAAPLVNPVAAMSGLVIEHVATDGEAALRQGRAVSATMAGTRAALLNAAGDIVAVAEREHDHWQPRVVLPPVEGAE